MSLDYSKGCVNFRDVGDTVNILTGVSLLPKCKILRGGKLDFVSSSVDVGNPGTMINLRRSKDLKTFGVQVFDFPISNDYEKYRTCDREVRKWLNRVIQVFSDRKLTYPVLIHCTSGKDRTGVVVAALLKILGIPDEVIIEEYLLSEGAVREEWITQALTGIGNPSIYLDRINVEAVKKNILLSTDIQIQ